MLAVDRSGKPPPQDAEQVRARIRAHKDRIAGLSLASEDRILMREIAELDRLVQIEAFLVYYDRIGKAPRVRSSV